MNKAKKGFEAANPGEKVTLVPIKAAEKTTTRSSRS